MYLTLPIPTGRSSKVTLEQCIDAFVKEEVMDKSDAWYVLIFPGPHCSSSFNLTERSVGAVRIARHSGKRPSGCRYHDSHPYSSFT